MTNTTFRLMSHDPSFRHLARIGFPYPSNICEMGDEDECDQTATFWLTARGSYVKPMLACEHHASEEHHYFGTPLPETAGER